MYLGNFSQDKKHIHVLDKKIEGKDKFRFQSIEAVAYENNLYTFLDIDKNKGTLEGMFSQIEGITAEIIRKISNKQTITPQDRNSLSIFISFLYQRTPKAKEQFVRQTANMYEKVYRMSLGMIPTEKAKEIMASEGKIITDKEVADLRSFAMDEKRSNVKVGVPQGYWIKQMIQLGVDIAPAFEICDWYFMLSEQPFAFITSDNPFLLVPSEPVHPFDGLGLLTPGARKILPLTSNICLVMNEPKKNPSTNYIVIDKPFFREINKLTARHAHRFIFSPDLGKIQKISKELKV